MSNFDRITGEQKKSIRNHGIIAVVLILIGVVVSIGKQVSGYISAILGVILLITVWSQYKTYSREINKVRDNLEQFKKEVDNGKVYDAFGVVLTPNYAVVGGRELHIYKLKTMKKFEVGIEEKIRKALFLTDKEGKRYQIAETYTGDGRQEQFDILYGDLKDYFRKRHR